jgi:hypothetical protein
LTPVSESSGAVQVEIETLIKLEFLWLKANITPDHWLKDFAEAPFKEEVHPLIFKENAMRSLGENR